MADDGKLQLVYALQPENQYCQRIQAALLVGNQFEIFEDKICGAVVSKRSNDRISIWTNNGNEEEENKAIG